VKKKKKIHVGCRLIQKKNYSILLQMMHLGLFIASQESSGRIRRRLDFFLNQKIFFFSPTAREQKSSNAFI